MRFQSSSAALVALVLAKDVIAAVHGGHSSYHRLRASGASGASGRSVTHRTVTDKYVTTVTETIYLTVDGPEPVTTGTDDLECDPTDPPSPSTATSTGSSVAVVTPDLPASTSTSTSTSTAAASPTASAPLVFTVQSNLAPTTAPTTLITLTTSTTSTTSTTTSAADEAPDGAVFVQMSTSASPVAPPPAAPTTLVPVVTPTMAPQPALAAVVSTTNKRGLAYNDASLTNEFVGGNSQIGWAYNWAGSSSGLTSGFEYIPTLWGNAPEKTGPWPQQASAAIAAGSEHLFSFNEPDLSSQSNIDYQTAARDHMTYMGPFAGKALIGAPAVTNGGGSMGLTYLSNFIGACTGCPIDFVNIHWYDSATNYGYFKEHIQAAYAAGGNRPVYITEFGASGTADQQNTFLQVVLPWLDAQDYVHGYAYFMCEQGVLINGNGLSTLGSTFMSYTSSTISSLIAK